MADDTKHNLEHSKKFFEDLSTMVVDAIHISRSKNFWDALKILSELRQVLQDAKDAMPELKDLNHDDAKEIAGCAYDCIKKIVEA